jgi:hypothetical protein
MQSVDVFQSFEGNYFLPAGSTGASYLFPNVHDLNIIENQHSPPWGFQISHKKLCTTQGRPSMVEFTALLSWFCRLIEKLNFAALQCQKNLNNHP